MTLLNKSLALNLNAIKDMSQRDVSWGRDTLSPIFSCPYTGNRGEDFWGQSITSPFYPSPLCQFFAILPLIISF